VVPDRISKFDPHENIIIGNVAFYGATAGEAYIKGTAGERFCVRNSGVKTVVEGVGDHGCEYMTGGLVVILGEVAGMSGGMAYVYDPNKTFATKLNGDMADIEALESFDKDMLKLMVDNHLTYTSSQMAKQLLGDWEKELGNFLKVMPRDYKRVLLEKDMQPNIEVKVAVAV
jgi:glutamate synthase (NADPH/NADH) large chain